MAVDAVRSGCGVERAFPDLQRLSVRSSCLGMKRVGMKRIDLSIRRDCLGVKRSDYMVQRSGCSVRSGCSDSVLIRRGHAVVQPLR